MTERPGRRSAGAASMARMTQITPMVPVRSIAEGLAFYRDVLGFVVGLETDIYAFLRRDDVAVRLVRVDADVDLHHPERQQEFYVDVRGLDDLFSELTPALSILPEGRVRAPFDTSYGKREFHVIDGDATLVMFGEAIR